MQEVTFVDLPAHIRAIAEKIAVKQVMASVHSQKLEAANETLKRLRSELAEMADEIEQLKVELRDECQRHAKENL